MWSILNKFIVAAGVFLSSHYKGFFWPLLNFLDHHKTCRRNSPHLCSSSWKVPYFLRQASPWTSKEKKKYPVFKKWLLKQEHYKDWFNNCPTAMRAPRQYIIPKLRKVLIVSPRYFGLHFIPTYTPNLLSDFQRERLRYVRPKFNHIGLEYLIAHCHGVSTRHICDWSGKTEVDVHKDVLDSLDGFVNTLPYWIWAYKVDMRSIPFTQKRHSRMKFTNRLKIWNDLNERPQFMREHHARCLLPKYLHTPEALSCLPKNTNRRPIDGLLRTVSTR